MIFHAKGRFDINDVISIISVIFAHDYAIKIIMNKIL